MAAEVVEYFHANGRPWYRQTLVNGMPHRTDGPAREEWDSAGRRIYRAFWVNGKRHNTDGPAWEQWQWHMDGHLSFGEFWINGEKLTEEGFRAWQQRQREFRALVFALEHKFPAEAPEREFLRHILPAHVAGEAPPL